jgi:rhodanese-related sulfurtransferase
MVVAHAFSPRGAILVCTLMLAVPAPAAHAEDGVIALLPHRAVYDLALAKTRGNSQVTAVRGRILYDFDGNACEGYTLKFRQVSELDSGEGKVSTSDLRSTTWEGGDAKRFNFASENFLDQNLVDAVDGHAEHSATRTAVDLIKPQSKKLDIDAPVVFPTEHMVRVIEAARAGKTILDFPVFDGSDTGDKVYNTLTVIGARLSVDDRKHADIADRDPRLAAIPRWPVTISYFEKTRDRKTTEQTPTYAISFELYQNGISRALSLDYNDFVVTGKLTSLEMREAKPCP